VIARRLRARRSKPHGRWHLDEMFVRIGGRQMYLWRAVDAEGEVLDVLVQARRDKAPPGIKLTLARVTMMLQPLRLAVS